MVCMAEVVRVVHDRITSCLPSLARSRPARAWCGGSAHRRGALLNVRTGMLGTWVSVCMHAYISHQGAPVDSEGPQPRLPAEVRGGSFGLAASSALVRVWDGFASTYTGGEFLLFQEWLISCVWPCGLQVVEGYPSQTRLKPVSS